MLWGHFEIRMFEVPEGAETATFDQPPLVRGFRVWVNYIDEIYDWRVDAVQGAGSLPEPPLARRAEWTRTKSPSNLRKSSS